MSKAKPLGNLSRAAYYSGQRNWPHDGATPRQRRRMTHKGNRNGLIVRLPLADNAKGRPTPRRKDAIAARRGRRG